MLCSYHSYAVMVLFLELLNLLNARPQIMKPPLSYLDDSPDDDDITTKKMIKRSAFKPAPYENGYNKTKERIINVRRRGSVTFSEQDIIFPDSYEVIFEPVPRIDGPPKCAEGSTFCESFDRYPYHHVRDILQRNTVYKDLFGKDEIPVEISNRVSGDDEMFVCGSIDKTIYPKIGKNKNSKWKYIINQGADDGFIQGVRIEICRNHGNACDIIGEVPNGYITYCKQKYVYRRMLSLSDSGTPVPDTFQLPSACCCAYRRTLDFLARFGAPITPAKIKR